MNLMNLMHLLNMMNLIICESLNLDLYIFESNSLFFSNFTKVY